MPGLSQLQLNALKERARQAVQEAVLQVAQQAATRLPEIQLDFSLRGRCAGQARMGPGKRMTIRINLELLQAYPDDYLSETIPHEVAHLAVNWQNRRRWRKPRPHGSEWQAMMRDCFQLDPQRCHAYQTTPARVVPRNFLYRCGCREHRLTSIMHNRIRKVGGALCKDCRERLTFKKQLV